MAWAGFLALCLPAGVVLFFLLAWPAVAVWHEMQPEPAIAYWSDDSYSEFVPKLITESQTCDEFERRQALNNPEPLVPACLFFDGTTEECSSLLEVCRELEVSNDSAFIHKFDVIPNEPYRNWLVSTDSAEQIEKWRRQADDLKPGRVLEGVAEVLSYFHLHWLFLSGLAISLLNYLAVGSFRLKPWKKVAGISD
jgi:hypothetical protein